MQKMSREVRDRQVEHHVMAEAEIGITQLQTKEHQGVMGPPARGKNMQGGFCPESHGKYSPADTFISD